MKHVGQDALGLAILGLAVWSLFVLRPTGGGLVVERLHATNGA